MRITLTPEYDTDNSKPSAEFSGLVLEAESNGGKTPYIVLGLPDGRRLTFDGAAIARAIRALGVEP